MTLNEYQLLAQRTSSTKKALDKLENGCMGLCGETGECMDIMKKYKFQGHVIGLSKLAEELGDVLWYVAELATGLGMTLDEVAVGNIEKLRQRYPDGFDAERSVNREEYKHD